MKFEWYETLLTYCMKSRHDRVMSVIRAAARCKYVSDLEYFGMVERVKSAFLWEAKLCIQQRK